VGGKTAPGTASDSGGGPAHRGKKGEGPAALGPFFEEKMRRTWRRIHEGEGVPSPGDVVEGKSTERLGAHTREELACLDEGSNPLEEKGSRSKPVVRAAGKVVKRRNRGGVTLPVKKTSLWLALRRTALGTEREKKRRH